MYYLVIKNNFGYEFRYFIAVERVSDFVVDVDCGYFDRFFV